jgi:multisubunit Na+/H+ antiporter MnhG subunit
MILASSNAEWVGIAAVIVGAILSLIGALALIIFNDIRNRLTRAERHLEGLLGTIFPMVWRIDLVEYFLKRELDYDPPPRRDVGPER